MATGKRLLRIVQFSLSNLFPTLRTATLSTPAYTTRGATDLLHVGNDLFAGPMVLPPPFGPSPPHVGAVLRMLLRLANNDSASQRPLAVLLSPLLGMPANRETAV